MPRQYIKRDLSYWNGTPPPAAAPAQTPVVVNTVSAPAAFQGKPFPEINYGHEGIANAIPGEVSSRRAGMNNSFVSDGSAFENIRALPLSYASFGDNRQYYGAKDTVELCMRAYGGIPSIRNAIEVSVEFSCQPLYIKTQNESMKNFFNEWFHAIQLNKLIEEFFREYYRSGNVFLYKFSGRFGPKYFKHFQETFGATENRLPIRYSLINPANVFVPTGLTFPYTYTRLLSIYDIERLRHPMTEQDKQVFNDLPKFVQDQIKMTAAYPLGIYIPMEPERLRFAFYKKQSYEPLATPMCYPVLPLVEYKLALMKMDKMVARTVERSILLVTTGETGTQYNNGNGLNPNNIAKLQSLFNNPTLGRVLVADYTTKAEWLIPDIQAILGPQKYEMVNSDIIDGLQSILVGGSGKDSEKFANAQIKTKIFIQRLKEGQKAFLDDFLMPEIMQVCKVMGFRSIPKIGFRDIDLEDNAVVARIYTQLAQLGILTGKQTIKALESGLLPEPEEMDDAQKEYKKNRDDGMYLPLVGASAQDDASEAGAGGTTANPGGRPPGTKGTKIANKKPSPIGTSRGAAFSMRSIVDGLKDSEKVYSKVEATLKKEFKLKALNESQIDIANRITDTVMAIKPKAQWLTSAASMVKDPVKIPAAVMTELDSIGRAYDLDLRSSIIVRNSRLGEEPV